MKQIPKRSKSRKVKFPKTVHNQSCSLKNIAHKNLLILIKINLKLKLKVNLKINYLKENKIHKSNLIKAKTKQEKCKF